MEEQSLEHISVTWHALLNETLLMQVRYSSDKLHLHFNKSKMGIHPTDWHGNSYKSSMNKAALLQVADSFWQGNMPNSATLNDVDHLAGMW